MLSRHKSLTDPREALARALWPHVSSMFDEGETGSAQNAGMGLFFIAEMTKLVGGRLVIASRGATLILKGDVQFEDPHGVTSFLEPGVGFPGEEPPSGAQRKAKIYILNAQPAVRSTLELLENYALGG